ncbi:MAG: beta-L-arabinofuranosidase domain-containing protein [Lentisphaeria bacterium]|jgi:hypothetical protein
MTDYKHITLAKPLLDDSQIRFRLGLARQRTRAYPLDSLDFVMIDLERPDDRHRHADWCTGDLTGRLLEFLSYSAGVDGETDPRLPELFERILKQRRPSGLFGRYASHAQTNMPPEDDFRSGVPRLLPGFIRYYQLTGDARALEAAVGMAQFTLSHLDEWRAHLKEWHGLTIEAWVGEPLAMLYGLTGDQKYLDFLAMIEELLEPLDYPVHAHGYLSTLRGLQTAALVTGDTNWNTKVEQHRQTIIERQYELPDGCIPECFPASIRTEGCAIADWMMLNLNAGLITGDEAAYARAEHVLWNAFAYNQLITGCFGSRQTTSHGYGVYQIEECVWCCVHNGGLALTEYARQAVTWRDGAIHVNLLVPGTYRLGLPDGAEAEISIATTYPADAEAVVTASHVPPDIDVHVRAPASVRRPQISEERDGDRVTTQLGGALGHYVESVPRGAMLKYGPLVLVPLAYSWTGPSATEAERNAAPAGYIPDQMPEGLPALQGGIADADGLLELPDRPLPDWTFFDEGPGGKCWVPGAAANVGLRFPDGETRSVRFVPQCYFTSCLALHDTPVVFQEGS